MKYLLFISIILTGIAKGSAQTSLSIDARLIDSLHTFEIEQELIYKNESKDTLTEIYLNDWANAFSNKKTPLARRFAEEFSRRFHFSKPEERGGTQIKHLSTLNRDSIQWKRPETEPDLIRIKLNEPLPPGEEVGFFIDYNVKIPSDKFTRYGVDGEGNYKLRYWYLTPAVYRNGWQVFSHRNLGNHFVTPSDVELKITTPPVFNHVSALSTINIDRKNNEKTIELTGRNRVESKLYLTRSVLFSSEYASSYQILTNIEDNGLQPEMKHAILRRILNFLKQRLGAYPHNTIFVTQDDYLNNPIYGLNQLPGFIRPFPDGFQYDIKQFKTITENILRNSVFINPRTEQWINDGLLVSLLIDYVDEYYPKMKLLGNLSKLIGVRWFHAADLEFNDQYQFLYMNTVRLNIDQPLNTAQDSLIKFNKNIANAYKAGVGIKYLEDYTNRDSIEDGIREFYREYNMKTVSGNDFQKILEQKAQKDISWFFDDFVATNNKIDFKISNLVKTKDSLQVTVKNKHTGNFPVSLYGLKNKEIVYKKWVDQVIDEQTVKIPRKGVDRLALNYEGRIPESNQRDNYKRVTTLFNKPLQFRLFQDIEDPRYNQVFFIPEFEYNLYDGISLGPKLYNKTVLAKNFYFNISPKYGFNSETLVGSASLLHNIQFQDKELYSIKYGISGSRFSYGYDLFYHKYSPFLSFSFRHKNLRNNERQQLLIRNVNVERDFNPETPLDEPNYNIFNLSYTYSKPHMVNFYGASFDYQLAKNFSKVSMSLEYRKLFKNNRQINLRFFSGVFLYNDTQDSDFFSFALDRPTDYLFDYNYYGRSQGSGLFSQQIIMAEGGFKSQLQPEYANQWMITTNASTNLWKWIFLYGDVGLVKNQHENAEFLYDSGVRLSLVDDYFEVFFPVYSNLGWEVAQANYDQKIRFIVSLDLNTLIRLFTRRWY